MEAFIRQHVVIASLLAFTLWGTAVGLLFSVKDEMDDGNVYHAFVYAAWAALFFTLVLLILFPSL